MTQERLYYSVRYYIYNTSHILQVKRKNLCQPPSHLVLKGLLGIDYLHDTVHISTLKTMNMHHCSQQRKLQKGTVMDATFQLNTRSAGFSNALTLEHSRTPACGLCVTLARGTVADG